MDIRKISNNIKKFRELKDITREEIAAQLDMSVSGYSKIERGEIDLTITKLDKIANIIGVSISQILNFDVTNIFNISNNKTVNSIGTDNKISNYNESDFTKKYIEKLEEEIKRLNNN